MALKALRDADGDETVTPEEVGRGEDVYCIDCGERLRVWRSHTREDGTVVIRHFKAPSGGSGNTDHNGCGGGEGESHKRAKNIAVGTLREFYHQKPRSASCELSGLGQKLVTWWLNFRPHTPNSGVASSSRYRTNTGTKMSSEPLDHTSETTLASAGSLLTNLGSTV